MLPDFPKLKKELGHGLTAWALRQVPILAPLLDGVPHFTQHEGKRSRLTRQDGSVDDTEFQLAQFRIEVAREDMRVLNLEKLKQTFLKLAEEMAQHDTRAMFQEVTEAAEAVGNTVNAEGDFRPEHFLELVSKIEQDFDPETEEPVGGVFVMHPDTAEKVIPKVKEWEQDPTFVAEYKRIMDDQRSKWRDRENRRKLVD